MNGRVTGWGMASASAAAIAAALMVLPTSAFAACIATGGTTSVNVDCDATAPDPTAAFTTAYPTGGYDGNGADTVTIGSGTIVQGGSPDVPPPAPEFYASDPSNPDNFLPTGNFLVEGTTQVETLGGDDTVTISGGALGTAAAPVSLELGDGSNTLAQSGGTIFGSVFGGNNADNLQLTGGTIAGLVFTGGGADTVLIDGTTIGSGGTAGPDAVGLEDGDDSLDMRSGTVNGAISGGNGADLLQVSGGTITDFLAANAGVDTIQVTGGTIGGGVQGNEGNDAITISGGNVGVVTGDEDDDTITVSNAAVVQQVLGGTGSDTVTITGGTLTGSVDAGADDDNIVVSGGLIGGSLSGGTGDNAFTLSGGTVIGGIVLAGGEQQVTISDTAVVGFIQGGGTLNRVTVTGGELSGLGTPGAPLGGASIVNISGGIIGANGSAILLANGDDILNITGGTVSGVLDTGGGADAINVSGGTINNGIGAGTGNDNVVVSGGATVNGGVNGGAGNDAITVSGGVVNNGLDAGAGSDTVEVSGGTVNQLVSGGDDADTINITGGTVNDGVNGGAGNDATTVSGTAVVNGGIAGGDGIDSVSVNGGTVGGGINAERVQLSGGQINGDISGISADTLVIDDSLSAPALDLANGVTFSGTGAVGTISNTDLAAGGETQNFTGFSSLTLSDSTLRFGNAGQGIGSLLLQDGATLFVEGPTALNAGAGFGNLSVRNSTLNLVNGDPTDRLTVGGLVLDGAAFAIDVDQDSGRADSIVANGAVTALGTNIIAVNLIGDPTLSTTTEIAIVSATGAPIGGTFQVQGISGTAAALFDYEIVDAPGGGLILRATPNARSIGIVTSVDSAAASAAANNLVDFLYVINNDVARYDLGLAGGPGASNGSAFGVFASGQLAHVEHDGFSVSDGNTSFDGPSFESDDFSGAISVDFNAAKYWNFDQKYGLNLGAFVGYASTDVGLDGFNGFDDVGSADNKSGMAGGYALLREDLNYLLVSGTTLFGDTDSHNDAVGSKGGYDTFGYALTASAGHIFAIGEKSRFDLRGGILGVSFKGDAYTDSAGFDHEESKVSFGAVKFEPGFFADYAWKNGMVFSPYARLELQQRFGYENKAGVDDRDFDFDDADFSASIMGGANLKVSESTTFSSELRGKFSSDSNTVAGKLGVKVAF